MDNATDHNTVKLPPGEFARANFLHWAWQIKFVAAKNTAHVVDKMLHACGGTGYKRDMELERYLRDAKAGWVMGPTNEVLRQFVGKAVLLGFDSLDYWNQTYNRRAVENELKKLDADGKRKLAEELLAQVEKASAPRLGPMATTVLLPGGLLAPDPSRETYPVSPGGATEVRLAGDDRIRIIDRHGGQVAMLSGGAGGARAAAGPAARTRSRCSAPIPSPGERGRAGRRPRRRAAWSPRPAGGSSTATRPPPSCCSRSGGRPRERARRWSCRRRWPSRGWTSGSTPRRRPATRSAPASTSRSSTCAGASARTSWRSMPHKLEHGIERGLDATVTRTLMGNAYPTPGLYGKFYDLDMDPLVEVVRDTVGRHDTFALACQAKYYEDMGYPGPHQLHRQLQRRAASGTRSLRARAGRRSTSSTTPL